MTKRGSQRLEETELRRLLERPEPPADLAGKLNDNWRAQRQTDCRPRRQAVAAAAGVIAAATAAVLLIPSRPAGPGLVTAAYSHIRHERDLRGRFVDAPRAWMARHRLGALPTDATLILAKNCEVDGEAVRHLRLRTANGGRAEVLVDTGGHWTDHKPASGRLHGERWRLIRTRSGRVVLIIHDLRAKQAVRTLVGRLTRAQA
ncbi:MAG: hypothetical protein ABEJ96_04515 [Thiohalorhabdaceae bacterium]